jgi:hypothetical protein
MCYFLKILRGGEKQKNLHTLPVYKTPVFGENNNKTPAFQKKWTEETKKKMFVNELFFGSVVFL